MHEIRSPLLLPAAAGRVLVKLEEYNPGESIKARVALNLVLDAEKRGVLTPGSGQVLIEPTGGNTGTGLAIVAAQRGYAAKLVIPDNHTNPHRLALLKLRGAEVILADHKLGNDAHFRKVRELVQQNSHYVWLDQFNNPANPRTHFDLTGPEIFNAVPQIDAFVAGIGSGGTISGIGRFLRQHLPAIQIVGVQPEGCDVLRGKAIPHKLQGLAVGMLPGNLDVSLVDRMESLSFLTAVGTLKKLAAAEGLFVGFSSGANIAAAISVACVLGPGKTVVTIAPDSGKNYPEILS